MIGSKVKLTKSMVKWYIEHQDIFFRPSDTINSNPEHDTAMQNCLYFLMGGEIIGTIKNNGADKNVYGVEFNTPFGNDFAYYELGRDIIKVKGK